MSLTHELAEYVLENHPQSAVTAFEKLGEEQVVERLGQGALESAASIIRRLSPQYVLAVLRGIEPERAARILALLPNDAAARVVRWADEETRATIVDLIEPQMAQHLRTVLGFAGDTAGALMDPEVLALPQELTVREALTRIRKTPDVVRYNVYVVDQAQRLVGAVNLRELLSARGQFSLTDVMVRDPHRLASTAGRAAIVSHPGWREVHALPVVDESDHYLGAIRYRVLRRLEQELTESRSSDMDTAAALGQVLAVGAKGVLDAISGAPTIRSGGDENV